MSKDSHFHYIHLHASHHADLLEDFCTPLRDTTAGTTTSTNATAASTAANLQTTHQEADTQRVPGHFLPFEDIHLPPHLEPVNPEDEDGVVPDEHAVWGIKRAMQQRDNRGVRREDLWRDLGMQALVDGVSRLRAARDTTGGVRREGKRSALLSMR